MKRVHLWAVVVLCLMTVGAVTASADEISFGGSAAGVWGLADSVVVEPLTFNCSAGGTTSCTVSGGPLGDAFWGLNAAFESPTGVPRTYGDYLFTLSGTDTLTVVPATSGYDWSFSGPAWTFGWTDYSGDWVTGTVYWYQFTDQASDQFLGSMYVTGVSCPDYGMLCFDFPLGGWGNIDFTVTPGFHLAALASAEGTVSGELVSSGQVTVPEPATLTLFGTGLVGLAGLLRRRKTTKS